MELVRSGTVFQGYVMRCALIRSAVAWAVLYPRRVSAAMVLRVS